MLLIIMMLYWRILTEVCNTNTFTMKIGKDGVKHYLEPMVLTLLIWVLASLMVLTNTTLVENGMTTKSQEI